MAKINVQSGGAAPLDTGILQLASGAAMSSTLTAVTDQANTASPLLLSTTGVQVQSTLRITTDSNPYIDAEDGSTNNRFTVGRDPSSQQVNVDFASNPSGSTTTVGAIRTYTDGVNLGDVVKFREDGQVTFVERVNVEADSLVTTQSSSVIASSTTNANLVIAPNGTGALVASIPDGTATGGNARGLYAVDLQMSRTNANQVAQYPYSAILSGQNNRNLTQFSVICGGKDNLINYDDAYYITLVGGLSNTVGGRYGFIGGGSGNTGGGYNTSHTTITGGQLNVASGSASSIGGGSVNTASGDYSHISGGASNVASASYSNVSGQSGTAYLRGQRTLGNSNGSFSPYYSNAQCSEIIAHKFSSLTTGATTVLSLDGTGTTNLIIPDGNNRMWNVQVRWVAVVTAITGTATGVTVGDTKVSTDLLAVAKRSGTTTVSAHTSAGTQVIETVAGSLTAANIAYSAGVSQEMAITFTGPTFAGGGSVTMRVVAAISLTEVAY